MIELPEGLDRSVYPLAWFVGEFTGSGKLGGNFGIPDREFESSAKWVSNGEQLDYSLTLEVDGKPYITESGIWKIAESRPETLIDELRFPVQAEISTTWIGDGEPRDGNVSTKSWTTRYVGVVGYGKMELLSDEIALHEPELELGDFAVNDLFRSKRIFGWVNNRILWAWDIALIGAHSGEENELKSIAAGGLWK
ncbi:MAG: heme-binding beta-barrel domain-containing protein [Candidatus Ancillula sp.]|nr:heme-binding beta-barrel domain-containing protein [Candidatus Ancillula sp.]